MKRAAKVDKNQPEIVKFLRSCGAQVLLTHQIKNAFDILVGFRGELFIMEIKNPESLPKIYTRQRLEESLSQGEYKCMEMFKKVGVPYHIVAKKEEAFDIIHKNNNVCK
ncbi:hypothetical protein AB832_07750 [Flavobacteriaceae bacterium (ex Bugula neritina AB1)]|nr:hypothetical protein AB832_07750 [Flavobacteriaceae bacterium (ex Bugula neritina AB1)]